MPHTVTAIATGSPAITRSRSEIQASRAAINGDAALEDQNMRDRWLSAVMKLNIEIVKQIATPHPSQPMRRTGARPPERSASMFTRKPKENSERKNSKW